MSAGRRYGVSTGLYQAQRLTRDHLREIAGAGFTHVEVRATTTHLDYHQDRVVADLQQWLADAGLRLWSVHAPVHERAGDGRPPVPLLLAATDAAHRARALAQTEAALHIARRLEFRVLVVHIGAPRHVPGGLRCSRDAARRSLEALDRVASPLGVRLAIEVDANDLSSPGALVHLIEDVLDLPSVGVCLDMGHGHLAGDLLDAIETTAEHLLSVDVHDNRGRGDDHLVPFEGTIDWAAALTTLQKVGYDGPLMFELQGRSSASAILARARQARQQMDRLLAD